MVALFIVSAPALVVMMMMTLRKSALRPLLSVSVPWSITCSSTLKTSGCAFSISSSSSTAVRLLGDGLGQQAALVEAHVARGRADQRLTAWRSMYSDMSKRINSMPRM
jgi:hypothetical protein